MGTEVWHIVPSYDILAHKHVEVCSCFPEIQWSEGIKFIVHHSYDGRAYYEAESDRLEAALYRHGH